MQFSVYKEAIVLCERNGSRLFQLARSDGFYKGNADKNTP